MEHMIPLSEIIYLHPLSKFLDLVRISLKIVKCNVEILNKIFER